MNVKKRVLVVDDEPGVRRFVQVGLSLAGYEVITAGDGEEALKLVDSARPDLMLLDVVMVPLSGLDVLARLRAYSKLPVIVFSARSDVGPAALKAGANGFITKPCQPEHLVRKIEEALDGHKVAA